LTGADQQNSALLRRHNKDNIKSSRPFVTIWSLYVVSAMPISPEPLDATWQELCSAATISNLTVSNLTTELATVTPTVAEIPDLVRSGKKILIAGGGSKLAWGGLVQQPDLVLRTTKLDRLIDHAVGDLTVTVEAGISFQQLQSQLATANQFLPLDPLFPAQASIGGIISTADTGSLRQRYGGVRDLLLGLSWVRPDGEVAKAGGRVVKNVAGYDLMKLFTGAYGTLGIIQQVSLRVYPLPVAAGSVWITGSEDALGQLVAKLGTMSLTPTSWDLLTASLAAKVQLGDRMGLFVRFQTIPESITAQSNQLIQTAQALGLEAEIYTGEQEAQLWQSLRSIVMECPVTAKIGLRPTSAVGFLTDFITAKPDRLGLIHVGSGIGLVGLAANTRSTELLALRQQCVAAGGYLSVLTAPHQIKQQMEVWGYQGAAVAVMQQLREQFDREAIFNPGKFF
jgi:glycolate oxidase FAD binding subunit